MAARKPAADHSDLAALSRADLLALAAEQDIPGRSRLSKAALLEALAPAPAPKRRARKTSLLLAGLPAGTPARRPRYG